MLFDLSWGLCPLLLSRFPAAVGLVPALGILRGPLGLAWGALALGVAFGRRPWPKFGKPPSWLLFLSSAVTFVVVGLYYVERLQASGDEPHYLLMAQSLWKERDLDLRDNLERQDYLDYTPGPLVPHYGAPRADGRPYPAHSPGLPLLLAPLYAWGGRKACAVFLALLTAGLGLQSRALAHQLTGDPKAALLCWAATVGPPVFFYSFHVYTEVPSALAVTGGLRLLLGAPGVWGAAGAALLAASLPWLHVKMIAAAAALAVVALFRLRGRPLVTFLLVGGCMALAFLAYYQSVYGHPTPLALYGGTPADLGAPASRALVGLFLDRSFGLLPHAPVFLLSLAGIWGLGWSRRSLPHVAVALAILVPVLAWRMWWGGQCPPARFVVPLVPFLGLGLAQRAVAGRGMVRWFLPLLGLGLALATFMVARPPDLLLLNRRDNPTHVWAALSEATPVGRYLPSLVSSSPEELRVAAVWIGAILLTLILDQAARRQEGIDRLFKGLGLPLVLLLLIGLLVDGWARSQPGASRARPPAVSSRVGGASDLFRT